MCVAYFLKEVIVIFSYLEHNLKGRGWWNPEQLRVIRDSCLDKSCLTSRDLHIHSNIANNKELHYESDYKRKCQEDDTQM